MSTWSNTNCLLWAFDQLGPTSRERGVSNQKEAVGHYILSTWSNTNMSTFYGHSINSAPLADSWKSVPSINKILYFTSLYKLLYQELRLKPRDWWFPRDVIRALVTWLMIFLVMSPEIKTVRPPCITLPPTARWRPFSSCCGPTRPASMWWTRKR